jgi:hypothetical protein
MKHIKKLAERQNNRSISVERIAPKMPTKTVVAKRTVVIQNQTNLVQSPILITEKEPLINIITRTSNRPNSFKRCRDSIKGQIYQNIRHIVSIDSLADKSYVELDGFSDYIFIDKEKVEKMPDIPNPNTGKRFIYNLYFNTLIEKINEGWVLILDDDDYLIDNNAIQSMVNEIKSNTDLLIFQMKYPTGNLLPPLTEMNAKPRLGRIGSPCILVHSGIAKTIKWDGWKCGDYRFISKVWDKTKDKRYIKRPLIMLGGAGLGLRNDMSIGSGSVNVAPVVARDSNGVGENQKILTAFQKKFEPIKAVDNKPYQYIQSKEFGIVYSNNDVGTSYDFIVGIPSYSRVKDVSSLVSILNLQKKQYSVKIIVIDDFSPQVSEYLKLSEICPDLTLIRNVKNNGKHKYWQTINNLLAIVKQYQFKWFIQLDDDFELTSDFFKKIQQIIDSNKGNFVIKAQTDASSNLVRWGLKHWVDGGAIYPVNFLNTIKFKLDEISMTRWANNQDLSSGVWRQMSHLINNLGYHVYIPKKSLVNHLGDVSIMNPTIRKKHKIITKNFEK